MPISSKCIRITYDIQRFRFRNISSLHSLRNGTPIVSAPYPGDSCRTKSFQSTPTRDAVDAADALCAGTDTDTTTMRGSDDCSDVPDTVTADADNVTLCGFDELWSKGLSGPGTEDRLLARLESCADAARTYGSIAEDLKARDYKCDDSSDLFKRLTYYLEGMKVTLSTALAVQKRRDIECEEWQVKKTQKSQRELQKMAKKGTLSLTESPPRGFNKGLKEGISNLQRQLRFFENQMADAAEVLEYKEETYIQNFQIPNRPATELLLQICFKGARTTPASPTIGTYAPYLLL